MGIYWQSSQSMSCDDSIDNDSDLKYHSLVLNKRGILEKLAPLGKPIFVDTNISLETLREISDIDHVLVMLAEPEISVRRFFERPDREKQFIYRLIMDEPDPERAMENYRQTLTLINSRENYDRYLHSGFHVIKRDENRSIEQTSALAADAFGLPRR